jgi:3-oxoadipate enol-lactonase
MRLAFTEEKNLAKVPTLFLHGNLASSVWWQPMLAQWKTAGSMGEASLYFADWRGCGKNPSLKNTDSFRLEDLAQDVLELIETLNIGPVAVVGHSLGGLISLKAMTIAPQLFSQAVLLDPVGIKGVVFDDSMYEAFRQMAASAELTRAVILSTIQNGETLPEEFKSAIAHDAFHAVTGIGTSVLEILKTVDLTSDVAQLKIPTLILHGRNDMVIPLKDSEETVQCMPSSRLEVLEAGHCWNVESPRGFVKRLRREFVSV